MAITYPKVRQSLPILDPALNPLLSTDHPIPIPIKYLHNDFCDILLLAIIDLLRSLIIQTVCAPYILRSPHAAVIVVVEREEGGGVEVRDVVFFCGATVVVRDFVVIEFSRRVGHQPYDASPSLRLGPIWALDAHGPMRTEEW